MADKKISQLSSASTPLAGTEVLPIVQSSTTVKVAADDLTVKNVRSNATSGILQIAGPAAAATRTMTVPDANFTAARTDAAQTFTGNQTFASDVIIGSGTLPTISGEGAPRAIFLNNTLIISGAGSIPSPYSQNLQIDIVWDNWGANPALALVNLSVGLREYAGTAGCVFGTLFAINSSGATFTSFTTAGITTSQATLTATSPANYTLRITIDPTSGTDRYGYYLTIPTSAGGTGTPVTTVTVSLV